MYVYRRNTSSIRSIRCNSIYTTCDCRSNALLRKVNNLYVATTTSPCPRLAILSQSASIKSSRKNFVMIIITNNNEEYRLCVEYME